MKLAIVESIWTDFISFDPTLTYNSNLWTISYELFAVIIVISYAIGCKLFNLSFQAPLLIILIVFTYSTHYFEFMLGATLGLILSQKIKLPFLVAAVILTLSLFMAALVLPPNFTPYSTSLFYPVAAFLLLASATMNKTFENVFPNKIFIKLGDISFGLYLIHFVTLNSIASFVFIKTGSLAVTFTIYITITLIISLLFTRLVDHPWTNLLDKLFRKSTADRQATAWNSKTH